MQQVNELANPQLLATVTEYGGFLVIELLSQCSIDKKCIVSRDTPRFPGQLILNTAKHLGVSSQAVALLKKVKPGKDEIGDLNWHRTDPKVFNFGWRGDAFVIKSADSIVGGKQWCLGNFVEIENCPAKGAVVAIDRILKR